MPSGRPTKSTKELKCAIISLAKTGLTDAQIAERCGISLRTFALWKHDDEAFSHAIKEAKDLADSEIENALRKRAFGFFEKETKVFCYAGKIILKDVDKYYPPDTTAALAWLNNRQRDRWQRAPGLIPDPLMISAVQAPKTLTFSEFCLNADYPEPYPKQIEMMEFGMKDDGPRLILGARGYGKTDYCVILGIAYQLYLYKDAPRFLIVTKDKERNASMLAEIKTAAEKNGVQFDKANAFCLRVMGSRGKDHSVSALTVGSSGFRGRHPTMAILDDVITPEDISEATRAHVKRIYNEINKLCPKILIIGQPVHKFDLYADLRPLLKKIEVIHGSIPELDADIDAQRLAGVDEDSIQKSYFLRIASESATPFDQIKYLDEMFIPPSSVAFIDPSFEGGDYTAMSIVTRYFDGVAVIGFAYKKSWDHCLDDFAPYLKKYNVRKLCFETNALGTQPIDLLNKTFKDIAVVGRKSTTNKHSRILAAGTFAHLIHLARNSNRDYFDQVVKYEYNAKHDDAPDSLASALTWIGFIRGKD